jgi:hypothetical protein
LIKKNCKTKMVLPYTNKKNEIKLWSPTWHFHSIIIYLPFSQNNHIQNFEEKKLFQHFANLIKIRSTHLLPILNLIIPTLCSLMIPLPLPMIWGTYMKLVTKYQISAINSCWEKCAYMFNVDKNQLSRQTGSRNLMVPKTTSVRPSFQNIFRNIFLSNYWWQKSDIWSQASHRYAISWEAYLEPSIILWKCQVGIYFFLLSSQIFFFKTQNQNDF